MKVWITEKPSVAEAIALSLGQPLPGDGYYRVDDHIISWALGHLYQLAPPEKYNSSWRKWKKGDLPLLPESLQTVPIRKNRDQIKNLQKLLRDPETSEIINACDAGREGELIFAWILDQEKEAVRSKYQRRLWLSALIPEAIQEGIEDLRPAEEFQRLEEAARARAEADWLLGMNATRAATISLRNLGTVSLGRVQTPTLALLVDREEKRKQFTVEKFWNVRATIKSGEATYSGQHQSGRIDKKSADAIKRAAGNPAVVGKVRKKKRTEKPPLLYDLTSLQRDASSLWGWSASRTLRTAQALYEEEKVLSYPRTDSRYLPEKMSADDFRELVPDFSLRKDTSRIFRNRGVTDHHAIVPVARSSNMPKDRQKLFDLVCKRVAEAFSPDALVTLLEVETDCNGEIFISKGRRYQERGWRSFSGDEDTLPDLRKGDSVSLQKVEAIESETKPPSRYSDGTLLGAMETAGSDIEDEAAREAMKEKGLGTPATRAAIIERLIEVEYVDRDGKSLVPTEKGIAVIEALRGSDLLSAELTGLWEKELRDLGEGYKEFRTKIRDWVTKETETLLLLQPIQSEWGLCPDCKKPLQENRAAISCWSKDDPGCGFSLWKKMAGKMLPPSVLRELLENGKAGPVRGFRSRSGKKFAAKISFSKGKDGKWQTAFNEDWA